MKKLFFFFFLIITASQSQAQFTRYVIKLKNKGGSPYSFSSPLAYLSQPAIDRRTRYGIAIDSTDLPVNPSYITQIKNVANVTVLNISKWLNTVTIQTTDANALTTINGFSFVQSASGIAAKHANIEQQNIPLRSKFETEIFPVETTQQRTQRIQADYYSYGNSANEIRLHNGEFLHNIGLRGQEMKVAVLDGGFFHYTTLKAFDSVNNEGRVIDTWDFVDRQASVVEDDSHGMQCLSTIAANIPGQFVGKAPKAKFYLYRTEDPDPTHENAIEEHDWVCGAERADSAGVDIISTSLGYTDFPQSPSLSHTYSDMNGHTTMGSAGADLAAKKGILVFASIGNDGSNSWHYLSTPSDGDSVVAVGAVNIAGVVAGFSSYGPSSDGQVKPDVSSVGVAATVQTSSNTIGTNNGTSFACPNMAGLGTCLWQGFPEFNNIKIIRALQQSGSKFTTPDDRVGYGIPNMKLAFANLLTDYATSSSTASGCWINIHWNSKDVSAMKYEIERKAPGETVYTKVGEMNASAGTSLTNKSYDLSVAITSTVTGNFSYRIRQIIDTAAATFYAAYIDTTNITISSPCVVTSTPDPVADKENVFVKPNPVSGPTVMLVIETPYAIPDMPIAVYDAKGRLMMQLRETKGSGSKTIEINISRLAKGKYYIKVLNGQKAAGTTELLKL